MQQFFGGSSFASAFGDNGSSGFFSSSMGGMPGMGSMGGMGSMHDGFPSMFGQSGRMDPFGRSGMSTKPPAIEKSLPCPLEDLYNGKQRKMKITRTIWDASG